MLLSPCWCFPVSCEVTPYLRTRANRVPFDSQAWKSAASEARYDMAWDLVHRDVLTGKTPAEVTELLGETESVETLQSGKLPRFDPGPNGPGATIWYYDFGGEKYRWGFGGAMLAVDFRDGKVIQVRKVIH